MRNSSASRCFPEKGYVKERSSRWEFSSKFFQVEDKLSEYWLLEKIKPAIVISPLSLDVFEMLSST